MKLFIDRYSGNAPTRSDPRPVNLMRLGESYNFVGSIDKASMQQSEDFWQWHVAEADLVANIMDATGRRWYRGLYHWIDPIGNLQGQAQHFLRAIDAIQPDFIAFDIEQYRSSWSGAWQVMSKQRIYDAAVFVVEYVTSECDLPRIPYSAKWYLEKYCPALVDYFGQEPAWVASYADYGQKVRRVTRGAFLAWAEQVATMPMPTGGVGVLRNPILRQVTSTQILPVCPANYDVSVVLDAAAFDAWLGG